MKIKCPNCSKVLAIPESAAGKVVKCPCGKQLRAPAAKAGGAAPTAQAAPAAPKPAVQASGGGLGGFDPAMFDELTDQDLKPMPGVGAKKAAPAQPTGNTAKLLQEHAATAGGASVGFHVGAIASPWNRLAAAIIDGFVIGFMAGPVIAVLFLVLSPMFVDVDALRNAGSEQEAQAAAEGMAAGLITVYLIALPCGYVLPIALYAWMVTKSVESSNSRSANSHADQRPG